MAAREHLGRYELLARLATGGMGEVFLARLEGAEGFEKLYAVKRVLPHLANDERFRKMMISEAQIASRMAHPNICQVYELGETNGQLYIVMEYLEGVTLLSLLRKASREKTPLELGFVSAVIGQVCDALQYAHDLKDRDKSSLGLVHRDVTPANVFVCESGVCKVLDFGIAKVKDSANTQTDSVKGKFAYMAPEQLQGKKLTRRVDVFALGVVAFEALALRRLFQRKTDYLTFQAVMEQPIADVRRYRTDLPASLVNGLSKALERRASDRWNTVREMREAMFAGVQPWSHDQIGTLIRERFASEINSTHRGVATALMRKGPPADEPIVPHGPDDDEDNDFPAVETDQKTDTSGHDTVFDRPIPKSAPPTADQPVGGGGRALRIVGGVLGLAVVGAGSFVLYTLYKRQLPPTPPVLPPTVDVSSDGPIVDSSETDEALIQKEAQKLIYCRRKFKLKGDAISFEVDVSPEGAVKVPARWVPTELTGSPFASCFEDVIVKIPLTATGSAHVFRSSLKLTKDE
ncbi:MAG TPA: serine/threonine-protein kinase [Kofleriaceae bacterium]|jgi:serine/threonine-protein kinase